MKRVVDVKPLRPYVLAVTLSTGARASIDVEPELYGEIFESLRDAEYFMRGMFDPGQGTIVWPNGADFSPEFLMESALGTAQRVEPAV